MFAIGDPGHVDEHNRVVDALAAQFAALYLPGASGEFVSTPDAADLDLTGDLTIITRAALADWSPASSNQLCSKYTSNTGYGLSINTSGAPALIIGTGAANATKTATANLSALAADAWKSIAVTLDVDNGASGYDVRFFTCDDVLPTIDSDWVQLGSTVTTATAIAVAAGTAVLALGAAPAGTASLVTGRLGMFQLLSGIGASGVPGGTQVAEWNSHRGAVARYRDAAGHVFTTNGSAWSETSAA